jgi:integrating conjugative element protein (TIGR03765 family)
MNIQTFVLLLATVSLGCSQLSAQSLTVIYDSGNTQPIAPYIKINGQKDKRSPGPNTPSKKSAVINYPVTTPSMQPGVIESQAMTISHFQTPLFILGSDEFSKKWLKSRARELKSLAAIGLLVEVKSQTEFAEIRGLAQGLQIVPVSGQAIAQQLGLNHYPVLISKTGIEQ